MGGRKRGRETLTGERNIDWLPLVCPHLGTWPATQARALTGNCTTNLSVCRPALSPPSHTSQGLVCILERAVSSQSESELERNTSKRERPVRELS